jgi:AraC-like DNA-binding protein
VQVTRHCSEIGEWRVVQRSADPRLRAYVHGYLGSEGYLPAALRERRLPSAEIAMLINFGPPHRRLDAADPNRSTNYQNAWVVGLHDSYQLSEAVGARRFMVIRFTPIGAHLFLKIPMDTLANRAVELDQIDLPIARRLLSRLKAAGNWENCFRVMDSLIAERIASARFPSAGLVWAWQRLQETHGQTEVGLLAAGTGCSRRHLIASFREHIGLPPKTVARILRFNHTVRVMNRIGRNLDNNPDGRPYLDLRQTGNPYHRNVRWPEVALDCGYYDQSHFIKEFQAFAGVTPAAFLRQMFPDDSSLVT